MIDAVDCAVPHPGQYPTETVLGYAGGHTYYQWKLNDVQGVRNEGRIWLAIWTALNKTGTLNTALGATDANDMASRLPVYNYDKSFPVFYDVEPDIYDRDPIGARGAIAAWKSGMHMHGYPNAYVYTVARQGGDWIAAPTGIKPESIPAGKVGVQYGGNAMFDFDVFTNTIGALIGVSANGPASWDDNDWQAFRNQVGAVGISLGTGRTLFDMIKNYPGDVQEILNAIAAIHPGSGAGNVSGSFTGTIT